jgi:hypothetical protein
MARAKSASAAAWHEQGFAKKITPTLETEKAFADFFVCRDHAVRAPIGGPAEIGAGGVRAPARTILLNGGFGYENLRLHSPVAVDDRV